MKQLKAQTNLFLLCLFAYFIIGSMVLTISSTLKTLIAAYGWSDSQGGLLISCLSIGNLVASLGGNILMSKVGKKKTLLLYAGLVFVSIGLLSVVQAPTLFYGLVFVGGLCWGGVNSLVNTLVAELYHGSAAKLNVLHAFYAVGAVLFPLFVGVIVLNGLSWRIPVATVALLALLLVLWTLKTPFPESDDAHAENTERAKVPFLREPMFYVGVLTFFVYVGVETSACAWLSGYLAKSNPVFGTVPSETMVSLMWLLMIVGRLLFAALGSNVRGSRLLVIECVGFLVSMLCITFFSGITAVAILAVGCMGLSMSAIYATTVGNNSRYITGSTVAPGLLFAGGGLGAAVVPFLAGLVSDQAGMQQGMLLLCGLLCLLLVLSLITLGNQGRERVL
ncbi:MAG: MFS transporter [Clostridia bacterium]